MRSLLLITALLVVPVTEVLAQDRNAAPHAGHAIVVQSSEVEWGAAPASLPPGAKAAVLEGDPTKPGPFTLRLLLPDGYRLPPHTHPGQERVTVISGTFLLGFGERYDPRAFRELGPGGLASMTPGTAHYASARGETVIQLNTEGPWGVTYVNPADDPRGTRSR